MSVPEDGVLDDYEPPPEETPEQKAARRDACILCIATPGEVLDLRGKQIGACGYVDEIAAAEPHRDTTTVNLTDNDLTDESASILVKVIYQPIF